MSKNDIDLLNICLEDNLFCALHNALCGFEKMWHTPSPVNVWMTALGIKHKLSESKRPELLLGYLFSNMTKREDLIVGAVLIYIISAEDWNSNSSPLKDELLKRLMAHGQDLNIVFSEFRKSEEWNEQQGYFVTQTDYSDTVNTQMKVLPEGNNGVRDLVSEAISSGDNELCKTLYILLTRIDYQKGHIYEGEVKRLNNHIAEINKDSHKPLNIYNNYLANSCNFGPGSTQNGDTLYKKQ